MDLLGDLATGLAAPNHQHRTARQVRRVAVTLDVDLEQVRGEGGRSCRSVGPLVGAGAEHHCLGLDLPGRRLQEEAPVPAGLERGDPDTFLHRRFAAGRVALQVGDDSVAGHEAIGIALIVRMAGQLQGPVRRDQAEAVPPAPPGLTHLALFEHDVRNTRLGELAADRESCLTATNDHHVDSV